MRLRVELTAIDILPKTRVGKQRLVVRVFDNSELAALYRQQLREIQWKC